MSGRCIIRQQFTHLNNLLYNLASWAHSGKDSGVAPQLKGARWFSYDELKKCSNGFSESNEIGSGGYGKVKKQNSSLWSTCLNFASSCFFVITFAFSRFRGACFLMDKQQQSKELNKDQCRVGQSSRLKLSYSLVSITKILLALWAFVLSKEDKCWFMNLCLMELLGKACQVISLCSIQSKWQM